MANEDSFHIFDRNSLYRHVPPGSFQLQLQEPRFGAIHSPQGNRMPSASHPKGGRFEQVAEFDGESTIKNVRTGLQSHIVVGAVQCSRLSDDLE